MTLAPGLPHTSSMQTPTPDGWYPRTGNPAELHQFIGGQWTGVVLPASAWRNQQPRPVTSWTIARGVAAGILIAAAIGGVIAGVHHHNVEQKQQQCQADRLDTELNTVPGEPVAEPASCY